MKNQPKRGFKELIGKTIKKIDASSINVVHIELSDGTKFSIHAEDQHHGVPIVSCDVAWETTESE